LTLANKDDTAFPPKQLRGFQKVLLQPGETKQVTFELTRRDLSYWDTVRQNWVIPGPAVGVLVGSSSRAIKCQGVLQTVQNGQSDGKGKG
jgi:beta-glucosidase